MVKFIAAALLSILALPSIAQEIEQELEEVRKDVMWCLEGDATYRIDQQPMRDYCPAALAGNLATAWINPEHASKIFGSTQQEWSREAARMSCSDDPQEVWSSIGLIAACQCHDKGRADRILRNESEVLATLQKYARCFEGFQTTDQPSTTKPVELPAHWELEELVNAHARGKWCKAERYLDPASRKRFLAPGDCGKYNGDVEYLGEIAVSDDVLDSFLECQATVFDADGGAVELVCGLPEEDDLPNEIFGEPSFR